MNGFRFGIRCFSSCLVDDLNFLSLANRISHLFSFLQINGVLSECRDPFFQIVANFPFVQNKR